MRDINELNDGKTAILCKTKEESQRIAKMLNRPCMFDDYLLDEDYKEGIVYTKSNFCYLDYYKRQGGFIIYNASEFLTDENPENKFFWGVPDKFGAWVNAGESDKPVNHYIYFNVVDYYHCEGWWMYVGPLPDYLNYIPKKPEFVEVSIKDLVDNPPKYVMVDGVKRGYLHTSFFKDGTVSLACTGIYSPNFKITDKIKVIY